LGKYSFDVNGGVGHYTGKDGPQQSAEEVIWSLPNGLQGYALFGAWNQRRVDAFTQIVRDPRLQRYVADKTINKLTGTGASGAVVDHRLNNASSCMGCHIDGMNRANNNLRIGLTKTAIACLKASTVWMVGSVTPILLRVFASSIHRPQKYAPRWKTIAACF
jgi:hypothetical protein